MNPWTALTVVACLAAYVILALNHIPIPVWLASIGTVVAGSFPSLFAVFEKWLGVTPPTPPAGS